jgi:hypothetical protein
MRRGFSSHCKECHRESTRKWRERNREKEKELRRRRYDPLKGKLRKYGLSISEYEALINSQDNRCAICGVEGNGEALNIDHCHETGKVRGLLCRDCNLGIGRLKDDVVLLQRAIEYLS